MAAAENLTDAELRRQLKKYGQTPGPITATTRVLYIKKLNRLRSSQSLSSEKVTISKKDFVNGEKLPRANNRQIKRNPQTAGFSSDDSDNEGMRLRNKGPLQRKSGRRMVNTPKEVRKSVSTPVMNNQRSTGSKITNGYSDESDEEENSEQDSWVQVTSAITNTSPGLFGSNTSNPAITRRRSLRNVSPQHNDQPSQVGSPSPLHSINTDLKNEDDDINKLFSQTQDDTTPASSLLHRKSKRGVKNGGDFLRRQALNHDIQQNTYDNNKTELNEPQLDSDLNGSTKGLLSRFKNFLKSNHTEQTPTSSFTQSKNAAQRSWSLQCAYLLPIGTIIFFCTLGLLYVTMRSEDVGPPMLQNSEEGYGREAIMANVNSIYEVLGNLAGNNLCEVTDQSNLMPTSDLITSKMDRSSLLKALQLIREHPEWNIILYKDEDSTLLKNNDSVTAAQYLETTTPILPTLCRFRRAIQKVLLRVFVVVTVCLTFWLFMLYRHYRLRKNEENRQAMFALVAKVLDILRKHHEASLDDDNVEPYLPIIHIRDMIIPSPDRRKMSKAWNMAVRFISASESRVRMETQRVSGEDFMVWRWIQVTSPGKRQQIPGRVWQGEAFDTNHSVNIPNISPTPCLKIRNMFDPDVEKDEDWHLQVQDSILEKCAGNDEILSIVVEKNSKEGLLYVKCASRAGAGKAFRSLHGSWFDGRLVTVKFIKLQRFHSRYPHTVNLNSPLKPSSSTPVSTFSAPDSTLSSGFLTSTPLKAD